MLNTMRRYARSWVVKALLGVLVVSFAVWGIGDVFRAGSTTSAATVDGLEISSAQLESEIQRNTELLRQRLGQPIDRRQAMALGVLNDSLAGLVARRLVDRHGRDLGLGVADGEIAQTIRDNPLFQSGGVSIGRVTTCSCARRTRARPRSSRTCATRSAAPG